MFEVGEYVVYGNKGVCKVNSVGPVDIPGIPKERQYYTLSQVYTRGSTIFTPVDSDKVVLRRVLTSKEAKDLINDAAHMNPVWIQNDKEREQRFTEILRSADTRSLFEMIIALHHRKERRLAAGKKATSTEERYSHAAEDILFGELGISLGIARDEVKDFVIRTFEDVR